MSRTKVVYSIEEALAEKNKDNEFIAGGTDIMDRINVGLDVETINISNLDELKAIEEDGEYVKIGALATLSDLVDTELTDPYDGLQKALGFTANLQIRNTATVGGNLMQKTRCIYFRNPNFKCLKDGGSKCFAREGDNRNHSIFDLGPCVAVHASTLGLALLAHEANLQLSDGTTMTMEEFFGDGSNPTKENEVDENLLITHVLLPKPTESESSDYLRVSKRSLAEWPTIELFNRMSLDNDVVTDLKLVAGAVAPRPLRLEASENELIGKELSELNIKKAANAAIEEAEPLSMNEYKVDLLKNSIISMLS